MAEWKLHNLRESRDCEDGSPRSVKRNSWYVANHDIHDFKDDRGCPLRHYITSVQLTWQRYAGFGMHITMYEYTRFGNRHQFLHLQDCDDVSVTYHRRTASRQGEVSLVLGVRDSRP